MDKKDTHTSKSNSILNSPFRRMLIIITITAICELVLFETLKLLSIDQPVLMGYMDTILLIILLIPLLYFLVIKPMNQYIEQCKSTKEDLFKSEQYYRAFTDSGEALIWKTDASGKCTFVNQTWLNFTGRSLEQELGEGWMEELHPDDKMSCLKEFRLAFELKEKCSMKYRIRHASGEYRWIQDNATPIFTTKGEFTGYIGHCLDIHDSKMAEDFILRREKEYRTLFEFSPIAAFFWDRQGTILFWNKAAEKTLGWAKEDTVGKNITLFFKPDYNHPEINYNIDDLFAPFDRQYIIREYLRKDGITILCEWHQTPIYGMDGKIQKVISMAKDITEQKRYEQELVVAKEKAEEMERLKSAFLANMSHELRSPLNSIIGFSELLSDPDYDPGQKEMFAQLINSGGKNLLAIITELMDFSKLEAGQVKVSMQPVALLALLHDLQMEYSLNAQEKEVQLILDADNPQQEIVINTDKIKLRQVLVNLISNALKFTKKGSIELGLRTKDSLVQFHVRDTGIGIPKEYQARIFDRFLQVDEPNAIKQGGIGLGLAISKSLVELLGGTIWVESRVGAGSVFYFTLPLQPAASQPTVTKIEPEKASGL